MTPRAPSLDAARRVADAVLYEGYLLYPYRASSAKNQVRWQFGVVGPKGAEKDGAGEPSTLATMCLVDGDVDARVDVVVRFLQPQWRAVQRVSADGASYDAVDCLDAGEARWIAWHEAVEQESSAAEVRLADLVEGAAFPVEIPGGEEVEILRDAAGTMVGRLVRTRWPLRGRLQMSAEPAAGVDHLWVLRVAFDNDATWERPVESEAVPARDLAARVSFVGTHLLFTAHDAVFVSLVDPPARAAEAARGCTNSRCWPVLAGTATEGARTSELLLGAPIILYDFPAIADESPGQLFDSTEIDEILTLRVMTLTDEEKLAARGTDPRAAAIIDRCDEMPAETLDRLHGAVRAFETDPPWWDPGADASVSPQTDAVLVDDVAVARGSRVRLRPCRRADAQDLFLAGMVATVASVHYDVDGQTHVGVTLDDDPASELHEWYGRYYYFGPEEIEPLAVDVESRT
jgi:hypothetical protein